MEPPALEPELEADHGALEGQVAERDHFSSAAAKTGPDTAVCHDQGYGLRKAAEIGGCIVEGDLEAGDARLYLDATAARESGAYLIERGGAEHVGGAPGAGHASRRKVRPQVGVRALGLGNGDPRGEVDQRPVIEDRHADFRAQGAVDALSRKLKVMVSLVRWPAASGPIGGAVEYVLNCVKLDVAVPVPMSMMAPIRTTLPPASSTGIFGVSKEMTPARVNLAGMLPLAPGPGVHGICIGVLLAVMFGPNIWLQMPDWLSRALSLNPPPRALPPP